MVLLCAGGNWGPRTSLICEQLGHSTDLHGCELGPLLI